MKVVFFLSVFMSTSVLAQNYISTSYYGTPPDKFRVELASKYVDCIEIQMAKMIFFDATNELREISILRKKGKWQSAGAKNNPKLKEEVDGIFAHSLVADPPCQKKPSTQTVKPISQ